MIQRGMRGVWVACAVLLGACASAPKAAPVTVAKAPVEEAPSEVLPPLPPRGQAQLVEVAAFGDKLVTSAAVSHGGRKFVNFPRWFRDKDPEQSVVEIGSDGSLKPFPDAAWNGWKHGGDVAAQFVSAQSIVVDDQDRLWVLDAGAPYSSKVLPGAAKLVGIDLATNQVVVTIRFDAKVAPESAHLNDVRVSGDGKVAYVSDPKAGRVLVVDLQAGTSRSVVQGHAARPLVAERTRLAGH